VRAVSRAGALVRRATDAAITCAAPSASGAVECRDLLKRRHLGGALLTSLCCRRGGDAFYKRKHDLLVLTLVLSCSVWLLNAYVPMDAKIKKIIQRRRVDLASSCGCYTLWGHRDGRRTSPSHGCGDAVIELIEQFCRRSGTTRSASSSGSVRPFVARRNRQRRHGVQSGVGDMDAEAVESRRFSQRHPRGRRRLAFGQGTARLAGGGAALADDQAGRSRRRCRPRSRKKSALVRRARKTDADVAVATLRRCVRGCGRDVWPSSRTGICRPC